MVRLILSILFFLLSLLIIFKAPINFFWRVTVVITEFPHLPIIATLILLASTYRAEHYKSATIVLSSIALLIFCSTIFRVYNRASKIDAEFASVFSTKNSSSLINPETRPFEFTKLFTGIKSENKIYRKIIYKTLNDQRQLGFDYYINTTNETKPCIIIIHGGSWESGDSQQLPDLNSYLSNRGYNVASINYRLAPEFKNPAPLEDTKDLIAYITKNCVDLKVDTSNFILLGRSAGAQIALLAAYTLHNPNIKGVISFYGPADMVWGAQIKGNKWVLDTDKVLSDYIGGSYNNVPEKYKLSSPVEFVNNTSAPTLIIHGEHDCMVSFFHSVRLQKKLNEYKVKNYFLDLPWATHGCDYNINGPSGQITTYTIERFINSVVSI